VDLWFKFGHKRVFGDSKTLRGFVVTIVLTGFFMFLLSFLYPSIKIGINPFIAGLLLGLGYSLGELPTSFLKRQFGVEPGGQERGAKGILFYGLEQVDSVVGSLIVAWFLLTLTTIEVLTLFVIGTGLHLTLDLVLHFRGYKTKSDKPFYLKH
jgi:CDP-diglyceride synthetase